MDTKQDHHFQVLLINIGKKIKELREERGISQEELSFRANIHRTQVSRIETGQNNVSMKSIAKLVEYFNISYPDFFDFSHFK